MVREFDNNGSIGWQHDLTGAMAAGATQIQPTADGGYIAVGNQTTSTYVLQALIMKISATGELQWSATFPETDQSFRGAFTGGNFTFESLQQTRDGGYIVSGVADAHSPSGYGQDLIVTKLMQTRTCSGRMRIAAIFGKVVMPGTTVPHLSDARWRLRLFW